jgi:hypothetical protein
MAPWSELPQIAVENIVRIARGRTIAGTNRFAQISQQWRDASEEAEPLQLFLDLPQMSEEELATATSWLSTHGQHVEVLAVQGHERYDCLGCWFSAVPALHHLRRLEVSQPDALKQLAPALKQMPHLQHLAVTLHMEHQTYPGLMAEVYGGPSPSPAAYGMFLVSAEHPTGWLPDMQELCPQLTSLVLNLESWWPGRWIDPDVWQLFSSGLQQLTVADGPSKYNGHGLCADSLVHLSALQQLTLDGVALDKAEGLAQELGALQQLHVYNARNTVLQDDAYLVHLAPSLVDYELYVGDQDVSVLTSFVHLTRLVLCGELPEGTVDALAALTGLRELGLQYEGGKHLADVVQLAAGMASLRSLHLVGYGGSKATAELVSCVAGCTQLTRLVLLVRGVDTEVYPYEGPWGPTLQQLTGLRCLTVNGYELACGQGSWLAPLTALTSLCLELDRHMRFSVAEDDSDSGQDDEGETHQQHHPMQEYQAKAQQLLALVQQWPRRLQRVVLSLDIKSHLASCAPID